MKIIIYIVIVLLFFSCNSKNKNLIITFDKANGLVEGNPVIINDYQIGQVSKIKLSSDYKIIAEIELNDIIRLPKDTEFTIGSKDFFTKAILVTPGKSKYYLSRSDKIIGQLHQSLKLDTIIDVITKEIGKTIPMKNQDSIIYEIHKLNLQIEEIKRK